MELINKWRMLVGGNGYILKSVNRHGFIYNSLNAASISTIFKALQERIGNDKGIRPLSGLSFRVGATLDRFEQGEPLQRVMLEGNWQADSSAIKTF